MGGGGGGVERHGGRVVKWKGDGAGSVSPPTSASRGSRK